MLDLIEDGVVNVDVWIANHVTYLWNPPLNNIMLFITNLGGLTSLLVLSAILLGFLIHKKRWRRVEIVAVSLLGGLISDVLVKLLTHRLRPENALVVMPDYSFPSGHATMSIIVFTLIAYSLKGDIKNRLRRNLFIAGNMALALLIGFSRIYLRAHWASDVIAGFALGFLWIAVVIVLVNRAETYRNRLGKTGKNKAKVFFSEHEAAHHRR
jgi:membrane-associated phospholipid phosphatase